MRRFIKKQLKESIALSKNIFVSDEERERLKNISWEDLIIDQANEESPIHLTVDVPWESDVSQGIGLTIQVIADTLYQLHINIADSLQGLGLGYKICKAVTLTYGHIYFGKGRMQNDTQVPKIISRLGTESNITCKISSIGTICVANDNPDKDYLLNFIGD